jgi:hypothetical protein
MALGYEAVGQTSHRKGRPVAKLLEPLLRFPLHAQHSHGYTALAPLEHDTLIANAPSTCTQSNG